MNYLRLLRLPGAFTAVADILAGFFIIRLAGLDFERVGTLPYMLGASVCLYLCGMVWNDVFDVEEDALYRPTRPLPSGKVGMSQAFFLGSVLAVAGLMLAMTGGMPAFLTAAALLLNIFLYNSVLKRFELLGPLSMGLCRGLNLFMGMCAHSYILLMADDPRVFLPPLLLSAYTTVITVISTMEGDGEVSKAVAEAADPELSTEMDSIRAATVPPSDPLEGERLNRMRRKRELEVVMSQNKISNRFPAPAPEQALDARPEPFLLWLGGLALLAVPLGGAYVLGSNPLALGLFLALAIFLARPLYLALAERSAVSVKRVVGAGITGICLLDAGFVAGAALEPLGRESVGVCAVVAGLLLPTLILRRYISVS